MQIKGAPYIVDLTRPEALAPEAGVGKAAQATQTGATGRSHDRVEISSKGLELETLKRDLDALPDVRLERVALAKQNLQNGAYPVEPGVLAQKVMDAFSAR